MGGWGSGEWRLVAAVVVLLGIVAMAAHWWISRRLQDPGMSKSARRFTGFVIFVAAALIAGAIFWRRMGQLTVALGIVGAAIAVAVQEVILSIAGWLAILLYGFYKVGDRVQLGDTRGDVIEIGMLRTALMEIGEWIDGDLYTGRLVRIANSFVFKQAVYNYTGNFPYIWDEIKVPVRYDSDASLARAIIERIAGRVAEADTEAANRTWAQFRARYQIEDPQIAPVVTMVANDNWVEFHVRYVVNYRRRRQIKDQFFTRLLDEINSSGGKVAIASSTFQVVAPSVLDVKLDRRQPAGES